MRRIKRVKKIKKIVAWLCISIAASLGTTNCYGAFKLTKKLHSGIGCLGNKWISEVVFVLCALLQVYSVAMLVDAIALNLVEFWTGKNPLSASDFNQKGIAVKTIKKDGVQLRLTYLDFGSTLRIQAFENGKLTGQTVLLKKSDPGVLYAQDAKGKLSKLNIPKDDLDVASNKRGVSPVGIYEALQF